jgi:hypothetical protein
MTAETEGDGYTLGLLVDLRELCRKIGDSHYRVAAELRISTKAEPPCAELQVLDRIPELTRALGS